jgi:predicted PurR-regulated permease PerM
MEVLGSDTLGTVIVFLAIVTIALWIALPFAIFGSKALLRDLIKQQKQTNQHLENLLRSKNQREEKVLT